MNDIYKEFWQIYKEILPDEDIQPLNLEEQKDIFFAKKSKGLKYNPIFKYRGVNNKFLEKLSILQSNLQKIKADYFVDEYIMQTKNLYDWVKYFSRKKDKKFAKWLYGLYGKPSEELVKNAKNVLGSLEDDEDLKPEVDAKKMSLIFKEELKSYGFLDWKIIKTEIPTNFRISNIEKTIFINKNISISNKNVKRLLIHELSTHILRYENGATQKNDVFKYGFHKFIECEEGLAIYSEEQSNLLRNSDMKQYCLRVIACYLAENYTFNDIYDEISKYTTKAVAFSITTRVKRGLEDTSMNYGYSKDQIYFSGYQKMKKISIDKIKLLYCGKIGFKQLKNMNFNEVNFENVRFPKWVTS